MSTVAVTAATGKLGRLVVAALQSSAEPVEVVAVVRDAAKAAEVLGDGVEVRVASYDDAAALEQAFAGVDVLVFISGSEVGRRVEQHRNVVEAAKAAGVGRVVYTSAPHADTTTLALAPEHKATEELLRDSGLAVTVLRNNWYNENYLGLLEQTARSGVLIGSAGDGRVASAARDDYAGAAAAVALGEGHEGATYELAGDTAWTMPELAAALGEATGTSVVYRDLSPQDHAAALAEAGIDEGTAGFLVGMDADIAAGTLADADPTLARLLGRPTTPLVDTLRAAVQN